MLFLLAAAIPGVLGVAIPLLFGGAGANLIGGAVIGAGAADLSQNSVRATVRAHNVGIERARKFLARVDPSRLPEAADRLGEFLDIPIPE